ncbi:MAG: single-stranded DNA-binding protein [Bacillus subtilis]|nr:single-stranded DNA-binding protein [Bacillus subtilis]
MLNQLILVGRLTHDPELRKSEEGRSVATIRIAVQRGFKSGETNEYETDFFNCTFWSGSPEATVDYCKKGSVIGVKGAPRPEGIRDGEQEDLQLSGNHRRKDPPSSACPEIKIRLYLFLF